jgi:hypothetical protein
MSGILALSVLLAFGAWLVYRSWYEWHYHDPFLTIDLRPILTYIGERDRAKESALEALKQHKRDSEDTGTSSDEQIQETPAVKKAS